MQEEGQHAVAQQAGGLVQPCGPAVRAVHACIARALLAQPWQSAVCAPGDVKLEASPMLIQS